jgi:hypothetical protein
MARYSIIGLAVLGVVAWLQPPLSPRPPACAVGRFVADGQTTPLIEIHDGTVALPGRCPPTAATFAAPQRSGTSVRATWTSCDGARLHLRGRLDADCAGLHGTLSDAAGVRSFTARRTENPGA